MFMKIKAQCTLLLKTILIAVFYLKYARIDDAICDLS